MIPILDGAVAKAAEGIVNGLMGGFDKLFTSKEEKAAKANELQQIQNDLSKSVSDALLEQQKIALDFYKTEMQDMADARNREIQIATSDKAPLINKIIQPILAILLLGSCFIFWYIILFKDIPKEKEMIIAGIVGSLTTISMGVVGYYFGSSTGSKSKADQLDKLLTTKQL